MTDKKRGFAALDPETRRAISSKGGKSAHARGVAHQWSSREAISAGKKGGAVTRERRREANEAAREATARSMGYGDTAETIPAPPPEEAVDGQ